MLGCRCTLQQKLPLRQQRCPRTACNHMYRMQCNACGIPLSRLSPPRRCRQGEPRPASRAPYKWPRARAAPRWKHSFQPAPSVRAWPWPTVLAAEVCRRGTRSARRDTGTSPAVQGASFSRSLSRPPPLLGTLAALCARRLRLWQQAPPVNRRLLSCDQHCYSGPALRKQRQRRQPPGEATLPALALASLSRTVASARLRCHPTLMHCPN